MTKTPVAFYDDPNYNYRAYWKDRVYEDKSERIALGKLLRLVPSRGYLIDIGAGYGRMTNEYADLFAKNLLLEPSTLMIKQLQRLKRHHQNLEIKKGYVEKLPIKAGTFDLALLIRTFHHLTHPDVAFKEIHRVLKPKGFLILEFPNKIHFKNILLSFLRRDDSFLSLTPEDISTKEGVAPFFNYHPTYVVGLLVKNGFVVRRLLTVSNFRHPLFKKLLPLGFLLAAESTFSNLASRIPYLKYFGPSIFILAQKTTRST